MLATAMDKANQELGLTAFKTPEEYLAIDDYTIWGGPQKMQSLQRNHKQPRKPSHAQMRL